MSRTGKGRGRNVLGPKTTKDYKLTDDEGPNTPLNFVKFRDCRSCGAQTPNYYHCAVCYWKMREKRSVALAEAEFFNGG